jgi:ribosomal protein S27AE
MKLRQIKISIESNIELLKQKITESNSFKDLCEFYHLPNNGKHHAFFKCLLNKYNISITHWHKSPQKKWLDIERLCPVCGDTFLTKSGGKQSSLHCSHKCSNSDRKHTDETKNKIKMSIRKYVIRSNKHINSEREIVCEFCGNKKITKKSNQRFCSGKCSIHSIKDTPEFRKKISDGIKKAIKEGRFKGWGIHKKGQQPSYPEKFFMGVLDSRNIPYKYDEHVGKYHIDFAIKDKMVALEIDGGQHKEKALKYRDDKKDLYLTENGWKVYRIPWKSINSEAGKQYIKNKIDGFVEFYNKT